MSDPTQQQVGGDHYRKMAIQPEAFIYANGIGFHEGNVIKYLCRWKDKGGVKDLEKAKHYIDLLINHAEPAGKPIFEPDWHNPENIATPGLGYRFLVKGEIPGSSDEVFWFGGHKWMKPPQGQQHIALWTYRTRRPLPSVYRYNVINTPTNEPTN